MKNQQTPKVRPHYNGAAEPPASPAKAPEPKLSMEPPKRQPEYPALDMGGLSDKARIEVKMERWRAYQQKRAEKRNRKRSIRKGFNRSR